MENQDLLSDITKNPTGEVTASHSPATKETGVPPLRRDNDSLDDFEHLEHDVSPVKESGDSIAKPDTSSGESPPRVVPELINTAAESVADTAQKFADDFKTEIDKTSSLVDTAVTNTMSSVTDLLDMGTEDFKTDKASSDLLADFTYAPPVPPHSEEALKTAIGDFGNFKAATQSFMDAERDEILAAPTKITTAASDLADRFSDSEPEIDEFKPSSNDDFKFSSKADEDASDEFLTSKTTDFYKPETFKDVIDEPEVEPELPKRDYFEREPTPVKEVPSFKPEPVQVSEVVKTAPEPKPISTPAPAPVEPTPEPERKPVERIEKVCSLPKAKGNQEVVGAEAMFCKMGLDAWFNPERLNPKVESLIYWRDPRKSGVVFGGTLVVLLSLAYFSLISVTAYLSLLALAGTISFRVYKNVLQAVQKTGDGHPFKELLDADVTMPQDKVRELTEVAVTHVNAAVTELRRLFLVEDLVDSIKFGVLLWCLTYLGAWFNGMTIIIIAFIALFTLPKVYENNKTQIDANLDIVRTKLAEITSKVKAAIPIGKKSEEKKEQ